MTSNPTGIDKDEALQFALILSSGIPHIDAIQYVRPGLEAAEYKAELGRWLGDKRVESAILHLQGKSWQDMSLEERIKFAIDKHYTEMAYFLYSHNYSELDGPSRGKADTCRQVLEAKIAGMSGKMDALTSFWADVQTGKINIGGNQPTPTKGVVNYVNH